MKTKITIALLTALLTAGTALAAPTHPTFGKFVNSGDVPKGSKLVVNITIKVTNDEDSGNVGYWALSEYNKQVKVWQDSKDSTKFYAVVRYAGQWTTLAGALSPQVGALELSDGSGTFEGGYVATFQATAFTPAFGNIGTFDFGGTKADILLGTYGAGQTGPTTPVSWLGAYFTGVTGFDQTSWGWTYHYKGQAWYNYDLVSGGTSGDIVTK